ncbi:MAG: iron hydrogenase small subunit [Gammaproteobacteria bacterium]|nr:iron hydrogenase small subunit [Gammaproteobacteria bacterium]
MSTTEEKQQVTLTIDDQDITVPTGTTILQAARKVGIHIPTLCYHDDLCVSGACRLCIVEIEGQYRLQASCAYPVTQPIVVHTHSQKVRKARRHILELLVSEHVGECYACKCNNNCELQSLAAEYGIDVYRFGHDDKPRYEIDRSGPIVRDMNKCIMCGRCVRACNDIQNIGAIEILNRGHKNKVGTFENIPLVSTVCINCGQCVTHCPTGALVERDDTEAVWKAIEDPQKHVVIQTAPAPRAAIGECFGLEPGHPVTFQLNTALHMCGFDKVFDTNFTADLTIIEEGTELLLRLYKALVKKDPKAALPQFTSCSPGWVKFIESFYPEYLPNMSSAKSPQQMFGALIKTYYATINHIDPKDIVSVSLMPCSAKKFECDRPEMRSSGYKDVDYALTTRELGKMISSMGIDLPHLQKSDFDDPFGTATGSGVIFGATGGVMESALRTVIELVTGKKVESLFEHADIKPVRGLEGVRYAELPIAEVGPVPELIKHLIPNWDWLKGATLKVAICHGTGNARKVMDDIKMGGKFSQCHFIEFMACPGGCLGGGGQPIPVNDEIRKARANAIYSEDHAYSIRKSHENPVISLLYHEFLTDGPCGHKSHELLHTHYISRKDN